MIRQDPILIAAPPRSGTTLLAGLLHFHGVWVGRARTTMYPGTNSDFGSENQDIKSIFKQIAEDIGYRNWQVPFPVVNVDKGVKDQIEHFVPDNTLWLVKTSWILIFWQFWSLAYPGARWLFPTRSKDKIIDSMNRHPGMRKRSNRKKEAFIDALIQEQKAAKHKVSFHQFNIESIVQKDPWEIDMLFTFLGIEPNYNIINDWIDPEIMKI